jgi:hypothetical protein
MAKLTWKSSYDDGFDGCIQHEARATHYAGGRYRIRNFMKSEGWEVRYCPPERRNWSRIGTAATEIEAAVLAQADNDRRPGAA